MLLFNHIQLNITIKAMSREVLDRVKDQNMQKINILSFYQLSYNNVIYVIKSFI